MNTRYELKANEIDVAILAIAQELCNKHDWVCRDPGEKCREKAPTSVHQMKREFAKVCRKHIKKLFDTPEKIYDKDPESAHQPIRGKKMRVVTKSVFG